MDNDGGQLPVDRTGGMNPVKQPAGHRQLVGRDPELGHLDAFLRRAAVHGGSLLLSGPAGVGKTALLNAAVDNAATSGFVVWAAGGAELEADLPFAVLHQLLLSAAASAARPEQGALRIALGRGQGDAPPADQVAADILALLRVVAQTSPVLLVVDDLQWADSPSREVLGLIADGSGRRTGLLTATDAEPDTVADAVAHPKLRVPPLTAAASAKLLDAHPLTMAAGVRRRVLAEAAGIPLALVELPAALTDAQLSDPRRLPAVLPLTDRLRAPFAGAVGELPDETAQVLLLMALSGSGDAWNSARRDARTGAADLDPSVCGGLLLIDTSTGRADFRHPMARAAVLERSTAADRRRAHQLLADAMLEQPDRRAWHLAESTTAPDAELAAMLDRAAAGAQRSGDPARAVDLLERAAASSPAGADRAIRLARAAYLGARVTGELTRARAMLVDAGREHPRPRRSLEIAIGAAFVELRGNGDVDSAHRLLVAALDEHDVGAGDPDVVEALHSLLEVCLAGADAERSVAFHRYLSLVPEHVAPELFLRARLLADHPDGPPGSAMALDRSIVEIRRDTDPTRVHRIADLALTVDRFDACREPLWRLVRDGRAGGGITSAIDALALLADDGFRAGRWDEANRLALEGIALAESHGYPLAAWTLHRTVAMLAAARGDDTALAAETDAMEHWAGPRGAGAVLRDARRARALGALGHGDFEQAYRLLAGVGGPGMTEHNAGQALAVMFDVVQAAARTDRVSTAVAHVAAFRRHPVAQLSPRLALLAAGSAAIVSSAEDFPGAFDEALAVPGVDRWPFDLARVRLAYGARLRRAHAMVQARTQLAVALDIFSDLGAQRWAAQAETELMATGRTRSPTGRIGPGSLTHQERAVAELAASGLTNKQIAHRLVISPRTASAHLRQIFAKLGITSRASIGDAMRPTAQI